MTRRVVAALCISLLGIGAIPSAAFAAPPAHSPEATLASIARDIEGVKREYPQLAEFSAERNLHAGGPSISYAYRTHKPEPRGGWTSGVPKPDEDGLWFYLDFHDPASTAEIHTQPMSIAPQCFGNMRVGFLILEGAKTASVNGALWKILRARGVIDCPR
jgi:hypothetical protein